MGRSGGGGLACRRRRKAARAGRPHSPGTPDDLLPQLAVVGGLVLGAVVLLAAAGDELAHDLRQELLRVDPVWTLSGATIAVLLLVGSSIALVERSPPRAQAVTGRPVPVVVLLGLIVVAAATFRLLLVRAETEPHVLGDELVYSGLAKGFALDGQPLFRGVLDLGHSLLYPLLLAPGYALTHDGALAYETTKTFNAVVVTLAAVPAYLLARRVVDPMLALVVAALVAFEPWTAYAAFVMTESLFLPVFTTFVLLLARMLERPTLGRQTAVLVTLLVSAAIRPQAVALVVAVVASIGIQAVRASPAKHVLRTYAPVLASLAVLAAATTLALAVGVATPAGGVTDVGGSLLDPVALFRWSLWNLAVYELALGVVAVAAFGFALNGLLRSRDEARRTTGTAMLASAFAVLLSVAAVSASPSGLDVLHERYLFYVTPLVLVGLAYWLQTGLAVSRTLAVIAAVVAVALAASLPSGQLARANNVDSPTGAWLQALRETTGISTKPLLVGLAVLGALVLLCARGRVAPILAVVVPFALLSGLDYSGPFSEAQNRELAWVDRAMPGKGTASLVHLGYSRPDQPCGAAADREQQQLVVLTEFFNTRVDRVFHTGEQVERDNLASPLLTVGPGGVVLDRGRPFAPRYVVLDSRQPVVGKRLARLDLARLGSQYQDGSSLALWRVEAPLRFRVHAQPLPPRADGGVC
ncbi:MAG TPA: hypothetical protein VHR46_08190 [Gaiella sp.]|nr:hypothetical protein [Gaiella sp.]